MKSTRIPAGEITFADDITVPFEAGDLTFEPVAPSPTRLVESMTGAYMRGLAPLGGVPFTAPEKPLDLSGSFTANLRDLHGGSLFEALTGPETWTTTTPYTLTVTYTRPRNPPIGELRRWAGIVSRTPWRRRSIASWRWLWRRTMLDTRSATFENVAINPGAGDTLTVETGGSVQRYDVVMYGRHA
jgi:hypothetical protein